MSTDSGVIDSSNSEVDPNDHFDSFLDNSIPLDNPIVTVADTVDNPGVTVADTVDNPSVMVADTVDNPSVTVVDIIDNPSTTVADNLDIDADPVVDNPSDIYNTSLADQNRVEFNSYNDLIHYHPTENSTVNHAVDTKLDDNNRIKNTVIAYSCIVHIAI